MLARYLCLAPALLLACVWGCDDERGPELAFPGGAGGASSGGQASCPSVQPPDGSPCVGTRTCGYPGPRTGCASVPTSLTARCVDGKWRSTNASANAIPALPICPPTPPVHGSVCGVAPSPCGSLPLACTWLLPECQVPVTGSCSQGTWSVSACPIDGGGGAGGEGSGGEGSGGVDGFGGAGGGSGSGGANDE